MALPAVNGNTLFASDLYQLARPAGGAETGKYYLLFSSYATGANFANYVGSQSRGQTPVSVVIDEADAAHGGGNNSNAAVTGSLTANGFYVDSSGTGIFTSCKVAGNYTINY